MLYSYATANLIAMVQVTTRVTQHSTVRSRWYHFDCVVVVVAILDLQGNDFDHWNGVLVKQSLVRQCLLAGICHVTLPSP